MNNNYKFVIIVAAISCCPFMSSSAFAKNYTFPGLKGLYGVATVAYAKYDFSKPSSAVMSIDDDTDTAYSAGIGYNFNQFISFEGGYLNLGGISVDAYSSHSGTILGLPYSSTGYTSSNTETDGFYLGPQLYYPIFEKIKAYIKAGVYFWELESEATGTSTFTYNGTTNASGITDTARDDGEDLYYGLGASYDITESLTVRADWTRYKIINADVDSFSAGLVVKFGNFF